MGTFIERVVARKMTISDYMYFVLLAIAAGFVSIVSFIYFEWYGLIITGLVSFGAWQLSTFRYIEYEYSVVENELDIDKIIYKKRRKKVVSIDIKNISEMNALENRIILLNEKNNKKIYACSSLNSNGIYYIKTKTEKFGNVTVFFEPDEVMLAKIKLYMPKSTFDNLKK